MKFSKSYFCLLAVSMISIAVYSQKRVNNSGVATIYSSIQAAENAQGTADVIIVEHSDTKYDGTSTISINSPVTIYGTGYYLPDNTPTQADVRGASCTTIEFLAGSEGSVLQGIEMENLVIRASNITVERCIISESVAIGLDGATALTNVELLRNIIKGENSDALVRIENTSPFLLANNLVENESTIPAAYNIFQDTGSGVILNNLFLGEPDNVFNNVTIQNNAFGLSEFDTATSSGLTSVRRNISENPFLIAIDPDNKTWPPDTLFCLNLVPSRDGQYGVNGTYWMLGTPNPVLGYGTDGNDVGMFGGSYPYVLSGIPEIPSIFSNTGDPVGNSGVSTSGNVKGKGNK